MQLTVNGEPREMPEGATVGALLEELGMGERWVVVDLNGEAVQRSRMAETALSDGDELQIVRPVAGGSGRPALGALYLVADPQRLEPEQICPLAQAGVDVLQLRMKDATTGERTEIGRRWHEASSAAGIPLVVNDDPDAAAAIGAEGLHLGQDDLEPSAARRIVGDDMLIGLSTHTLEQVEHATALHQSGLIDYIGVGPYSETPTKPGRKAIRNGLIPDVARRVSFPWFAIGGVDGTNIGQLIAAGATRVAVVRAILEAADPCASARELAAALRGLTAHPIGAEDL